MSDAPWFDETKLLMERRGVDGETRTWQRALARQRTVCQRAAKAARDGVPFEAGDPKTGQPWRPGDDVVYAYESGLEDARLAVVWREERRQAQMVAQADKVLRRAARVQVRVQAQRRKVRVRRAWKIAGWLAPGMTRRVRRWQRRRAAARRRSLAGRQGPRATAARSSLPPRRR